MSDEICSSFLTSPPGPVEKLSSSSLLCDHQVSDGLGIPASECATCVVMCVWEKKTKSREISGVREMKT